MLQTLRTIERDELANRLKTERLVLVEALPPAYYEAGHLPGARHLPQTASHDEIVAVLPDKQAEVVVYCASETCRNSDQLAQRLQQLGYEQVAVYRGGKADWAQAGLPIEI